MLSVAIVRTTRIIIVDGSSMVHLDEFVLSHLGEPFRAHIIQSFIYRGVYFYSERTVWK